MPTYNFKNNETGEEFEEFFHIADREEYLKNNPHIQQLPSLFAMSYSGTGDMVKNDNGYEWLGEDDELTGEKDIVAREIMGEEYSKSYFPPTRIYDDNIKADKKYIDDREITKKSFYTNVVKNIDDYSRFNLIYENFIHPTYKQLHGKFIDNMSIIDLLMNMGDSSKTILFESKNFKS